MIRYFVNGIAKDQRGFTLIELIVVLAILSILGGIAIPKLNASRKSAAVVAHNANVKVIESAAGMYLADGGEDIEGDGEEEGNFKVIKDGEDVGMYLKKVPEVPKGAYMDKEEKLVYGIKINKGEVSIVPKTRYIEDGAVKEINED